LKSKTYFESSSDHICPRIVRIGFD